MLSLISQNGLTLNSNFVFDSFSLSVSGLPNECENFSAYLKLSCFLVRDNTLVSGQDRDSESSQDCGDLILSGVDAKSRLRDSLDAGNDLLVLSDGCLKLLPERLICLGLLPSSFQPAKASTARIRITAMMSMMLNFPMRFAFSSMVSSVKGADAPVFGVCYLDNIRLILYNIFRDSTTPICEREKKGTS